MNTSNITPLYKYKVWINEYPPASEDVIADTFTETADVDIIRTRQFYQQRLRDAEEALAQLRRVCRHQGYAPAGEVTGMLSWMEDGIMKKLPISYPIGSHCHLCGKTNVGLGIKSSDYGEIA